MGRVGQSRAVLAEQEERAAELPFCLGEEVGRGWASPRPCSTLVTWEHYPEPRFLSLGHACDPMS